MDGSPDTPAQVLAKLNQAIAGGGALDVQRSAVSAANVLADFPVPHATFTRVPYASVAYDKLGEFNSTISRFTATRSGEYMVCAWLTANGTFTPWELDTFINGVRQKAFAYGNPDAVAGGCRPTHLNATDHLEIWVWQYSGSTQTFVQNCCWSWLTIHRID